MTSVVAAPSRTDLAAAFAQAMRILEAAPRVRRVVTEDSLDRVMDDIERDLAVRV
jgi:hypothetical protein